MRCVHLCDGTNLDYGNYFDSDLVSIDETIHGDELEKLLVILERRRNAHVGLASFIISYAKEYTAKRSPWRPIEDYDGDDYVPCLMASPTVGYLTCFRAEKVYYEQHTRNMVVPTHFYDDRDFKLPNGGTE